MPPYTPEYGRARYERDKERLENKHKLRKYGITQEQYEALLLAQGNACAICGITHNGLRQGRPKGMSIDHDHNTGKVRGLLCDACNLALGKMEDDPERLEAAARYLRSNG